ncbi:MAG: hypothetical protein RBR24_03865, partial [Candidatus Carbobacillus sp.]|nr:hypothetical protein [Candidatus Carbobacillus sp.]
MDNSRAVHVWDRCMEAERGGYAKKAPWQTVIGSKEWYTSMIPIDGRGIKGRTLTFGHLKTALEPLDFHLNGGYTYR